MSFTSPFPTRCIERHPTKQSIVFAGVAINLSEVARRFEPALDRSYLSRIFRGERQPSVSYARGLAEALGMSLQALLDELHKGE